MRLVVFLSIIFVDLTLKVVFFCVNLQDTAIKTNRPRPMPFVKCPECGKLNSVKLKTCPKCETSMVVNQPTTQTPPPASAWEPPVEQQPVQVPASGWGQVSQPEPPQVPPSVWGQGAQPPQAPAPASGWGQQPPANPWGQPAQQPASQGGFGQQQSSVWGGQPKPSVATGMIVCPVCQNQMPADALICGKCGNSLPKQGPSIPTRKNPYHG